MGFLRGTYRWEAESLNGEIFSRELGDSTTLLVPSELKAFRLMSRGSHAIEPFIEKGLCLNDLTITGTLIEIRNPGEFDKLTLTLQKEFPLGSAATSENYLVRATRPNGNLFISVRPGRIVVTTNWSDLPE